MLREQLATAQKQVRNAYAQVEVQRGKMGLVDKVQIGTLPPAESALFALDPKEVEVESEDGYQKYLLGNFRSYEASMQYRNLLREFGLTDAWVVPFMDGRRIDSHEAEAYATIQAE